MALYDPKPKIDAAPSLDFTVAEFLEWARTKPADEGYCYYNARGCAIAQFGDETGRPHLVGIGCLDKAYPTIEPSIHGDGDDDWTFGALVKRLEALV